MFIPPIFKCGLVGGRGMGEEGTWLALMANVTGWVSGSTGANLISCCLGWQALLCPVSVRVLPQTGWWAGGGNYSLYSMLMSVTLLHIKLTSTVFRPSQDKVKKKTRHRNFFQKCFSCLPHKWKQWNKFRVNTWYTRFRILCKLWKTNDLWNLINELSTKQSLLKLLTLAAQGLNL